MDLPSMKVKGMELLIEIPVNAKYLLGIYQGGFSQYDIVLKYRQLQPDGKWTRVRTPKHIHWAVDILIKMHENENATKRFVDSLIDYWHNEVKPLRSDSDRKALLDVNALLRDVESEASRYSELSNTGEYSVKFLLLIARLLMVQEKTNREDAYMFKRVLENLRDSTEIYRIISNATLNERHRR